VGFVVGQSGTGQVFSKFFGFPCNRHSLHQLLHNHPHVSSGEMYNRPICGRSTGAYMNLGDQQRDLMGVKSHPTKKKNCTHAYHYIYIISILLRDNLRVFQIHTTPISLHLSITMALLSDINDFQRTDQKSETLNSYVWNKMVCDKPQSSLLLPPHKHNRPLWVAVQGLIRPTPYTYCYLLKVRVHVPRLLIISEANYLTKM
jgi:hypothetical protein